MPQPAPLPPVPATAPTPEVGLAAAGAEEPDRFGELVAAARRAFAEVRDYSCILIKQERLNGKLAPEQTAVLSVRERPLSVHLRFTAPSGVKGQEVCYVAGRHGGKMRVRGSGLKAALGFITMALDHPLALAQSRHTVAEAGIGNLIDRLAEMQFAWQGRTVPVVVPDEVDGRPCTRVELLSPDGPTRFAHRVRIAFDAQTQLPVRFEAYDPPAPGEPAGLLRERYTYTQLTLNPGMPESVFAK